MDIYKFVSEIAKMNSTSIHFKIKIKKKEKQIK